MPKYTAESDAEPPVAPPNRWSVPDEATAWTPVLHSIVSVYSDETMLSWLPRDVLNMVGAFAGKKHSKTKWEHASKLMQDEENFPSAQVDIGLAECLVAHGFVKRAIKCMQNHTESTLLRTCCFFLDVLRHAPYALLTMSSAEIDVIIDVLCSSFLLHRQSSTQMPTIVVYFETFARILHDCDHVRALSPRAIDVILQSFGRIDDADYGGLDLWTQYLVTGFFEIMTRTNSDFARDLCKSHTRWIQSRIAETVYCGDVFWDIEMKAMVIILRLARFGHWTVSPRAFEKMQTLLCVRKRDKSLLYREVAMLSADRLCAVFPSSTDSFSRFVRLVMQEDAVCQDLWPVLLAVLRLGAEYAPTLNAESDEFHLYFLKTIKTSLTESKQGPVAVLAQLAHYSLPSVWTNLRTIMCIIFCFKVVSEGCYIVDDDLFALLRMWREILRCNHTTPGLRKEDLESLITDWQEIIDGIRRRRDDIWSLAVECGELLK